MALSSQSFLSSTSGICFIKKKKKSNVKEIGQVNGHRDLVLFRLHSSLGMSLQLMMSICYLQVLQSPQLMLLLGIKVLDGFIRECFFLLTKYKDRHPGFLFC